ncbi:hypothetical protein HX063_15450 [Myroides odoratimimus]|uniref:hypothetical protein n=1 Tax=Myroides odoratimimus TaxID=76832 RepID=UPI0025783E85|nr:hypothetical protein [Myroides odoratimimus]MDM1496783.1 hypothetical protein [Myroides odoratimimus]MDM1530441.1 hypothetical protein [Myroides odoratimimus]
MIELEVITRFLTIVLGILSIVLVVKRISKPNYIVPLYAVFLLFFWIPLILDTFIGIPDYSFKFNVLNKIVRNSLVGVYYNLYVCFLILVFSFYSRKRYFNVNVADIDYLLQVVFRYKKLIYFVVALPLILLFFVDNPLIYLYYRALNDNYQVQSSFIDAILLNSTFLSCLLGSVLLFVESNYGNKRTKGLRILIVLILLLFAVIINGKRNVVPVIIVIYFSLIYFRGDFSIKKLIRTLVFSGVLLFSFISFYGKYSNTVPTENYARTRIDFGRLEVTKFVIYNEIVLNRSILEFRGQSFLFNTLIFVPRSIWEDKPQPYAVYMTKELLNFREVEYLGWSMTTSIFEESISNLGFWLALFFPFVFFLFFRQIIALPILFRIIGFFVFIMLLVVQFSAVSGIVLFGLILYVLFRIKRIIV